MRHVRYDPPNALGAPNAYVPWDGQLAVSRAIHGSPFLDLFWTFYCGVCGDNMGQWQDDIPWVPLVLETEPWPEMIISPDRGHGVVHVDIYQSDFHLTTWIHACPGWANTPYDWESDGAA